MNKVIIIGRLTKDPVLTYTPSQTAIAKFTLAVDRPSKDSDRTADFIPVVVFSNQAENCATYLSKGSKTAVLGRIQTGSYEKDGQKVYTTDVIAENVEFLDTKKSEPKADEPTPQFASLNEDIPF